MSVDTVKHVRVATSRPIAWRDFQLLIVGALVLLGLMVLGESAWLLQPLRIILGLTYVLFAPGYCLAAALFPRADDLDSITRSGMSLGLSIVVVASLTPILGWLPWGIRPWPILLCTYGAMMCFIMIALWRRSQLSPQRAFAPTLHFRPQSWWRTLAFIEQRLAMLLGNVILLATSLAIWIFVAPSPDQFLTEFYILGQAGQAQDYPRSSVLGEMSTATLGVTNRERAVHTYRIEIWVVDGWNAEQRKQVGAEGPFTLSPSQGIEQTVSWRMPQVGTDQQVELLLFIDDHPAPYRQLRLWLNVHETAETN